MLSIVFNLIEWAISTGKLEELINVACRYNPGNKELQITRKELFSNV